MIRLFVNNEEIDLQEEEREKIRRTFVANDVQKPDMISSNFSTQFNIILNKKNERILNFISNLDVNSLFPYQIQNCQLFDDGIETEPNLLLLLEELIDDNIIAKVFSGTISFFQVISKNKISDLNSLGSHLYDYNVIQNSQSNSFSDVFIYDIQKNGKNTNTQTSEFTDMLPSIFAKSILDSIISESGFVVNLPQNADYEKLLLTCNNEKTLFNGKTALQWKNESWSFFTPNNFDIVQGLNYTITPRFIFDFSSFGITEFNSLSFLDKRFIFTQEPGVFFSLSINLRFRSPTSAPQGIDMAIVESDSLIVLNEQSTILTTSTSFIDSPLQFTNVPLDPSKTYHFSLKKQVNNASNPEFDSSALDTVIEFQKEIQHNQILADVEQIDFFKEYSSRFQWLIQIEKYTNIVNVTETKAIEDLSTSIKSVFSNANFMNGGLNWITSNSITLNSIPSNINWDFSIIGEARISNTTPNPPDSTSFILEQPISNAGIYDIVIDYDFEFIPSGNDLEIYIIENSTIATNIDTLPSSGNVYTYNAMIGNSLGLAIFIETDNDTDSYLFRLFEFSVGFLNLKNIKIDTSRPIRIEYNIRGFSQENELRYEGDNENGNFTFSVINEKLQSFQEIFESIFSFPFLENSIPQILRFELNEDNETFTQVRVSEIFLLWDLKQTGGSYNITANYQDEGTQIAGITFSLTFTVNPAIANRISMQYFFENYWQFVTKINDKPVILKVFALIDANQINEIDFSKLIGLDYYHNARRVNGIFYLNKIEQWYDSNIPAKTELILLDNATLS